MPIPNKSEQPLVLLRGLLSAKSRYVMNIELDDKNKRLYGEQEVTYTNNSPDILEYLWLQLDQNIGKKDSPVLQKILKVTAHNIIYDLIDESLGRSFCIKTP